jgi:hypothetical protein
VTTARCPRELDDDIDIDIDIDVDVDALVLAASLPSFIEIDL